jgi:hypothetical protein
MEMKDAEQFGRICRESLLRFTTMVAILQDQPSGKPRMVANGTGMFLNTGKTAFLVTSAHVYDGFLRYRENDPSTSLCLSGKPGGRFLNISEAEVLGIDNDCEKREEGRSRARSPRCVTANTKTTRELDRNPARATSNPSGITA